MESKIRIREYQDPFYYTNNNHAATFGPNTNPNSNTYTGVNSGVTITTESTSGSAMNVAVTTVESVLIPQSNWTIKYVDSEETFSENGAATNSFDGNTSTIWHTKYSTGDVPLPHEIQIDLGSTYNLTKLRYLPRQDGSVNGRIAQYELYVSSDGTNWGSAVSTGTFSNDANGKDINFPAKTGRYIRLRALSEVNNNPFTSIAELNVFKVIQ